MRRMRKATAILLAVPLCGCLEAPLTERLDIRMLAGGASVVSLRVSLRDPSDFAESPKLRERLESETRALEEGTDPWSARFAAASPARERDVRDTADGKLIRLTRHGRLATPDDLRAFLRDAGVGVSYDHGEGWEELTLLPGHPLRVTSAERERVKTELASWSTKLSAYFASLERLYDYLDRRPERARVCLASIVSKVPEGESLTGEESRLTDAVEDAMGACGAILTAAKDDAYTLDELSRRVYDPFPAAIRIAVPGAVVEREGFAGAGDAPLEIPEASLWSAFTRLQGRFASPDLAVLMWRQDVGGKDAAIDVDALAAARRRAGKPSADEIRAAIEDQLRTAPVYRVRWAPEAGREAPLPFDDEASPETGTSARSAGSGGSPA